MAVEREERWASLMRSGRNGNRTAYATLLREVGDVLRPVAWARLARLGLGPEEAEDAVQETLIALHTGGAGWDGARPILPWIHAIARHKVLDAARRTGRARRGIVDLRVEDLADRVAAPDAAHPPAREVARLVTQLPEREREVVEGLAIEGSSVAELAGRLGVGDGAVRVAFHRGLSRLRAMAEGAR